MQKSFSKIIFNSSEPYDVLTGNGVRLPTFTIEPNQEAQVVMTHHPRHEPYFDIHRVAGKVCATDCPENADKEVVRHITTIKPPNPSAHITLPGTYYLHSPEAPWMGDPCNPVIVEVYVYDKS